MNALRRAWPVALLPLAAFAAGGGSTTAPQPPGAQVGHAAIAAVPLGDVAGAAPNTGGDIRNPYANSPEAVQQGHELFVTMNCAGCHGYEAKGGMGPDLTDTYWRYGGSPVAIFKSIYEGRPQGMPAWNPALPPEEIWKLAAYIESLGGAYTAAQYHASIQGDRPGENVAPEVRPTLAGAAASASQPKATSDNAGPPDVAVRPDAGGTPPGSKP
ncbi:MAG TPA: c-type cytochrome [Burkholderiaceae bacterium]